MGKKTYVTGVSLTDNRARIAVVDASNTFDEKIYVVALEEVSLTASGPTEERYQNLEAALHAMGCNKRSLIWVACSFPEISFAKVRTEKMPLNKLTPIAWMKFRRDIENLSDKVVFDFEVLEAGSDGVVDMWDLTAFAIPYESLKKIEEWFNSRYRLQGITVDLFACRNLLSRFCDPEETVTLLACGNHISRIMQIKAGQTLFTRTIKVGSESLRELVERDIKRRISFEEIENVLNMTEEEYGRCTDPEKKQILKSCEAGINRMFIQVGRALDYYTLHLKKPHPQQFYLTGNTVLFKRFIPELSDRILMNVQLLDPAMAGVSCSESVIRKIGDANLEGYSAAIGATLGQSGHTPNLICTNDVKEKLRKIVQVRVVVATIFIVLVCLLFGVLMVQINQIRELNTELDKIKKSSSREISSITMDYGREKLKEIQRKYRQAQLLTERYKLVCAISEIQNLTPKEILIKSMKLTANRELGNSIQLTGIVIDTNESAGIHLAKYVVDLNASPLFSRVLILPMEDQEVAEWKDKGAVPFKIEGRFANPNK